MISEDQTLHCIIVHEVQCCENTRPGGVYILPLDSDVLREREREIVCACVCERESVCERERECVCVCVRARECVCERE